jgi:hypothetical protein
MTQQNEKLYQYVIEAMREQNIVKIVTIREVAQLFMDPRDINRLFLNARTLIDEDSRFIAANRG